jgi:hypothetical protein
MYQDPTMMERELIELTWLNVQRLIHLEKDKLKFRNMDLDGCVPVFLGREED